MNTKKKKSKEHLIVTIPLKDLIIGLITTLILISGLYLILNSNTFNQIIYPAYMSTMTVCEAKSQSLTDLQAYANQSGFNILGVYDGNTNNITLITDQIKSKEQMLRVIRHESCHQRQDFQNRNYNCQTTRNIKILNKNITYKIDTRLFLFFNEIEAYLSEYTNYIC